MEYKLKNALISQPLKKILKHLRGNVCVNLETITLIRMNVKHRLSEKFAAIISDMGRKEGPQEGYTLLNKLRASGNATPFIIYASSNLPEHKRMAKEHGAVGSTNKAQELFQLVMNTVSNGA